MRRVFIVLGGIVCLILIVSSLLFFYFTHKTHYLDIDSYQNSAYMEIVGQINLKDYPNTKIIADKMAIKKILNYLHDTPLLSVYGYFDADKREFIIPELLESKENSITADTEKYGSLVFYNDDMIEKGRVIFYNEKYIEGLNYHAYKVKNKDTYMISEIESLDLK